MRKQFAVLGLGSFGRSVALTLENMGCDVIVVDKSRETIQEIADRVTYAITADITEKEALSTLGTRNLDGAIIGVAENLEAGIMATLLCKEIGIPMVVAKAKNKLQGTILKKVGADTVVYPEIEMGSRVAKSLLATEFTDWIELSNDYSMVEIAVPKPWINHSMAELGIRTKYGVTVVGIMQDGNVNVEFNPQMPLPENAQIKELAKLQKKSRLRDEKGIFLVEGPRMTEEIPAERIEKVYASESFAKKNKEFLEKLQAPVELLTDTVFAYVSDTKTPQGILAIVKRLNYMMNDLMQVKNQKAPHLVVLDNLQDPGNLGTIFRTAEAAGVTGILLSKDCVDVYNPKVIRSTMGAVFRMPFLYVEDLPEKIKELQKKSIKTYAAHLRGENAYDEEDYTTGCAFLIGNEGNGLRDEVADCADCLIRIPMEGEAESLNAAVAAAVLMFEAGRQRRKK